MQNRDRCKSSGDPRTDVNHNCPCLFLIGIQVQGVVICDELALSLFEAFVAVVLKLFDDRIGDKHLCVRGRVDN